MADTTLQDTELFVDRFQTGTYQVEADMIQDDGVTLLDVQP